MIEEIKLTKEVKALWLEALKSGKYPKGVGMLKTDKSVINEDTCLPEIVTKYCCLGVLAEIHPRLGIHEIEDICTVDGSADEYDQYGPFHQFFDRHIVDELIEANDQGTNHEKDFSDVIPIIESLIPYEPINYTV